MDQFVTTYRKDYLWPYIRSFGKKLIEPPLTGAGYDERCACRCYPPKEVTEGHHYELTQPHFDTVHQDWSRICPMGPLLDAKLYPVLVGKSPETNTMRDDQPNRFLRKLHEKYPFLYEILQTTPEADLVSKVNKDRLRTTYQVDYCKIDEIPPDNLLRASGVEGLAPNAPPVRPLEEGYRQNEKPALSFSKMVGQGLACFQNKNIVGKGGSGGGGGRGGGGGGGFASGGGGGGDFGKNQVSVWVPGKTEYQDEISKMGDFIMREKLHYHVKTRLKLN